jgi:hypothetical protein
MVGITHPTENRFYLNVVPFKIIREMPKTLEDVADLGSYICALDKG